MRRRADGTGQRIGEGHDAAARQCLLIGQRQLRRGAWRKKGSSKNVHSCHGAAGVTHLKLAAMFTSPEPLYLGQAG